jgi:dephospho-CoA kinase
MRVFGLTGGIGSGKSTVARIFSEEGIPVIDADLIAREIVEQGSPVFDEIVRRFGTGILLSSGGIDRKKLGGIVFADARKRAELDSITHPAIAMKIAQEVERLRAEGHEIAIVEAALIFEANRRGRFESVIAVRCDTEEQIRRMISRDGITREEALQRISSQMDPDEKARASETVIDNSGDIESTRARVRAVAAAIKRGPAA